MKRLLACAILLLLAASAGWAQAAPTVTLGSKEFPESMILSEAAAILVREAGAKANHRASLGGTEIVYRALVRGDIDLYPDYTGTIAQVLMKAQGQPGLEEMQAFLARQGVGIMPKLGFNDGYGLAVTAATQQKYGLRTISDLKRHPGLRLGFTHEFVRREDGWRGLSRHYGLEMPNVRGMQHQLAYRAIANGQIDLMEIYTTDAQIKKLGLKILEDDRRFFPRYDAVFLYRLDLPRRAPAAFAAVQRLSGTIDEQEMIQANGIVDLEKKPYQEAAEALLREAVGADRSMVADTTAQEPHWRAVAREIGGKTIEHLQLVGISLLAAILAGVPLGVLAARSRLLGTLTLSAAGILQTIPSLALLALMIPALGIGAKPALVALFLYGLLPIIRNTYVGLTSIPPNLAEAADALGLSPWAKLVRVSLPMASPAVMAGIKTSAVISVGTATIAAFIGAGGLGDLIKAGIDLQRNDLLLQGSIPAALLALGVEGFFNLLDRLVIPRGLRLPVARG